MRETSEITYRVMLSLSSVAHVTIVIQYERVSRNPEGNNQKLLLSRKAGGVKETARVSRNALIHSIGCLNNIWSIVCNLKNGGYLEYGGYVYRRLRVGIGCLLFLYLFSILYSPNNTDTYARDPDHPCGQT